MKIRLIKQIVTLSAIIMMASCSKKVAPTVATAPQKSEKPAVNTVAQNTSAEGQKIYNANCGRCHELHSPSEYSASDWQPIMRSMARKAKLSDTDKELVMAYVTVNAKK